MPLETRPIWCMNPMLLATLLCLILPLTILSQQKYLFDIQHINVGEGLPHRNTYHITQDRDGFIWVNTLRTISRYDGYNFKTYSASFLGISEYAAASIAIDHENRLWYCGGETYAATHSGVVNLQQDTVYAMEHITGGLFTAKDVLRVQNSSVNKEDILITTRTGKVYKYNGRFEEIYHISSPISAQILCEALADGSYWIMHGNTVIKVKDRQAIQTFILSPPRRVITKIVETYPDLIIRTHSFEEQSRWWKLENDSLVAFNTERYIPKEINDLIQLPKDYNCTLERQQLIIQGKQDTSYLQLDEKMQHVFTDIIKHHDTFLDSQNNLWICTGNGLLKITAKKNPFEILEAGKSISGIYQEDHQLWVGINAQGVVHNLDHNTRKVFWARHPATLGVVHKDIDGHLWMGTTTNEIFEYIPDQDKYISSLFDNRINSFVPYQNPITKNYWIGTKNGLFQFDKNNKSLTLYDLPVPASNLYVRHVHQNKKGIWWVSNKGLFLMNSESEAILKHYTVTDGLPTDNLNHLHEDKAGIFWLGSKDGGLVRWDRTAHTFHQYTQKDDLSNNNIYAVYEDDTETLWLPSDYGLMAFDKNTLTTQVYLPKNGIAHEEFNTHAHFQAEDGTLYFGGLEGLTKFHPRDLRGGVSNNPPLHATRVEVLEHDAETFTNQTTNYLNTKKINLAPRDRMLVLELTLLDYEQSAENQYAYKMGGRQKQWIYTKEPKISITNLPYGQHKLVIKGRGASGNWSDDLLTIPISVRRPFYLQIWFILTMFTLAVTLVFILVRWRVRRLEKEREHLEQEVQKRTQQIATQAAELKAQAEALQELDQIKTQFFSNITHEFRTPLTLVIGPVEQLLTKQLVHPVKKNLTMVLRNARGLLKLVNQLLDISKLEGKQMRLEWSRGDIVNYTQELVAQFEALAQQKLLHIEFTSTKQHWEIHFDADKWNKTIKNLI